MTFTETAQLATAIGVGLTFIAAVIGILYNTNRARQSKYVDTITTERIKWLEKIRSEVADLVVELEEFYILRYQKLHIKHINDPVNTDRLEEFMSSIRSEADIDFRLKEISKLSLKRKIQLLKLRLNREEEKVVMNNLNYLYLHISFTSSLDDVKNALYILSELIPTFQTILKFEWEKAKKEAKK